MKNIITTADKKNHTGIFKALCLVIFFTCLMAFPKEVFHASVRGLETWWNIVFPALLPFFIVSNLMMSFGIVHFLGVLLEPLMKPIFNIPGNGAFVMAMGYTSGFPIGTVLTVDLRKNKLCTRNEGERLMSFTNNASPLFMFGAVAIGMFHNPQLGAIIAVSHYCANLCLGLLLRFHGYHDPEQRTYQVDNSHLLSRSIYAMLEAQRKDGRPLGQQLGDAIKKSVHTLSSIGGFIILFSVVLEVLFRLGIIPVISNLFGTMLEAFSLNRELSQALAAGLFEVTLGSKFASEVSAPLYQQLIAVSLVLGWSGLSVHAQIASFTAKTDLRLWPFVLSRIAHGILAAFFITLFLGPAYPAFSHLETISPVNSHYPTLSIMAIFVPLMISLAALAAMTAAALVLHAIRNTFGFRVWG